MRKKKQKKSDWAIDGDTVRVIDNNIELALKRFKKMIKDSKKTNGVVRKTILHQTIC